MAGVSLFFRARNSIGKQQVGCLVSIVPAGPPDPPVNCTAEAMSKEDSISDVRERSSSKTLTEVEEADAAELGLDKPPNDAGLKQTKMLTLKQFQLAAEVANRDSQETARIIGSNYLRRKRNANYEGPEVAVSCLEGFDGGLPQSFFIEAWQGAKLRANLSR